MEGDHIGSRMETLRISPDVGRDTTQDADQCATQGTWATQGATQGTNTTQDQRPTLGALSVPLSQYTGITGVLRHPGGDDIIRYYDPSTTVLKRLKDMYKTHINEDALEAAFWVEISDGVMVTHPTYGVRFSVKNGYSIIGVVEMGTCDSAVNYHAYEPCDKGDVIFHQADGDMPMRHCTVTFHPNVRDCVTESVIGPYTAYAARPSFENIHTRTIPWNTSRTKLAQFTGLVIERPRKGVSVLMHGIPMRGLRKITDSGPLYKALALVTPYVFDFDKYDADGTERYYHLGLEKAGINHAVMMYGLSKRDLYSYALVCRAFAAQVRAHKMAMCSRT